MKKMKKFVAVVLMALVLGVAAPAAFADDPNVITGITGPGEMPGNDGPGEMPGKDDTGDTAGRVMIDIFVYLATNLVA